MFDSSRGALLLLLADEARSCAEGDGVVYASARRRRPSLPPAAS